MAVVYAVVPATSGRMLVPVAPNNLSFLVAQNPGVLTFYGKGAGCATPMSKNVFPIQDSAEIISHVS
ncbi:hypothetical protein SAMN04515617_105153 [Collimonas sp. OK242]|uniref:hypothetical protein n=1 Tax=Collimonas sp. OK242 TaxID=1798195 RepID=UPI00089D441A|nr:hypothetical protein [Collimonas sp. OK242]SDX63153.1 hypothetical protein SAMN04515617_105153 [Collimonas sp. OK242]